MLIQYLACNCCGHPLAKQMETEAPDEFDGFLTPGTQRERLADGVICIGMQTMGVEDSHKDLHFCDQVCLGLWMRFYAQDELKTAGPLTGVEQQRIERAVQNGRKFVDKNTRMRYSPKTGWELIPDEEAEER